MTSLPTGEFQPVNNRPGMESRDIFGAAGGFESMFLSEIRFDQGGAIPLHVHPCEEAFVVLEGRLTFRLGDERFEVGSERAVRIPPHTPHGVQNDHPEQVRAFAGAPWNQATFYLEASKYLEGAPRGG